MRSIVNKKGSIAIAKTGAQKNSSKTNHFKNEKKRQLFILQKNLMSLKNFLLKLVKDPSFYKVLQ